MGVYGSYLNSLCSLDKAFLGEDDLLISHFGPSEKMLESQKGVVKQAIQAVDETTVIKDEINEVFFNDKVEEDIHKLELKIAQFTQEFISRYEEQKSVKDKFKNSISELEEERLILKKKIENILKKIRLELEEKHIPIKKTKIDEHTEFLKDKLMKRLQVEIDSLKEEISTLKDTVYYVYDLESIKSNIDSYYSKAFNLLSEQLGIYEEEYHNAYSYEMQDELLQYTKEITQNQRYLNDLYDDIIDILNNINNIENPETEIINDLDSMREMAFNQLEYSDFNINKYIHEEIEENEKKPILLKKLELLEIIVSSDINKDNIDAILNKLSLNRKDFERVVQREVIDEEQYRKDENKYRRIKEVVNSYSDEELIYFIEKNNLRHLVSLSMNEFETVQQQIELLNDRIRKLKKDLEFSKNFEENDSTLKRIYLDFKANELIEGHLFNDTDEMAQNSRKLGLEILYNEIVLLYHDIEVIDNKYKKICNTFENDEIITYMYSNYDNRNKHSHDLEKISYLLTDIFVDERVNIFKIVKNENIINNITVIKEKIAFLKDEALIQYDLFADDPAEEKRKRLKEYNEKRYSK